MNLEELRRQYTSGGLRESDCVADPMEQLRSWVDMALLPETPSWFEPNAFTLATSDAAGHVTGRIVLLKAIDDDGIVFFTNYASLKGQQLAANPFAAAVLFWPHLERQVRIEGVTQKVDRARSESYFASRPRGSQISAAISEQSAEVTSRDELERRAEKLDVQLQDQAVPMPESWGGYKLIASRVEFWQGRLNRLHDRIEYQSGVDGDWSLRRLSP